MVNKVTIINFGKFKFKEAQTLFNDYLNRLKHYTKIEVKEIKITKDEPEFFETIKERVQQLTKDSKIMLFSEKAETLCSNKFSKIIENINGSLSIVVGSSWGYPDYILNKANYIISFGNMTLPHELVRVLTAEQLYRAFTIIKGEKYNK